MNLVIDVSVFIDRLFIYDEERSRRARNVFQIVDRKGHNVFEPQVFGIELASQLVRRRPRDIARRVYDEVMERVIVVEEIDYDLLLDVGSPLYMILYEWSSAHLFPPQSVWLYPSSGRRSPPTHGDGTSTYNVFPQQEYKHKYKHNASRRLHKNIYKHIISATAFQTGCRAIDTYCIATASIVDGILISADKAMVSNARRYGVDAYYIHDAEEYNKLISKLQ